VPASLRSGGWSSRRSSRRRPGSLRTRSRTRRSRRSCPARLPQPSRSPGQRRRRNSPALGKLRNRGALPHRPGRAGQGAPRPRTERLRTAHRRKKGRLPPPGNHLTQTSVGIGEGTRAHQAASGDRLRRDTPGVVVAVGRRPGSSCAPGSLRTSPLPVVVKRSHRVVDGTRVVANGYAGQQDLAVWPTG
jgi:hypothetical protein